MFNWLSFLCFNLSGVAVVLVFLLRELIYVALASGIVWTFGIIANFIFTYKPLLEFRKTRARILGRVEKKDKQRD